MNRYAILFLTTSVSFAGCAAHPLQAPDAGRILVTKHQPSPQCEFLGEVRGSQGNFLTAAFTPDAALVEGARNKLRDQARALNANYVAVQFDELSHNTAEFGLGGGYSSVIIGNAYRC